MDDCDEILTFGLAHVSHMSRFNGFDQTDRNEFHGRIIDQFLMITVDSAPADNQESTLGTGTNDLGKDTRSQTTLYSGKVEGACGLFGNSIDTGHIAAHITGSNCDHIYSVEDELLCNCDHKTCVDEFLIVTQRGRLMMKLVLIVTHVRLRMNLSESVVRTQYLWMLLTMIIHVSH